MRESLSIPLIEDLTDNSLLQSRTLRWKSILCCLFQGKHARDIVSPSLATSGGSAESPVVGPLSACVW